MRIHQLATELNLTAKDLAPHLKKLGIQYKNHMSTISEDDVARITNLVNPPTAASVVEQRIRPTLIRRRRKEHEEPAEAKESIEEEVVVSAQTPETVHPEPEEKEKKEREGKIQKTAAEAGDGGDRKPLSTEPIPSQEVTAEKKEEAKTSKIKIIATKVLIPEEEEEDKKVPSKKRRRTRERFFPADEVPPPKYIPTSSKELVDQDSAPLPEEPARITKIFPPRKKKTISLVKGKKTTITVPKAIKRKIKIVDGITVGELAKRIGEATDAEIDRLVEEYDQRYIMATELRSGGPRREAREEFPVGGLRGTGGGGIHMRIFLGCRAPPYPHGGPVPASRCPTHPGQSGTRGRPHQGRRR